MAVEEDEFACVTAGHQHLVDLTVIDPEVLLDIVQVVDVWNRRASGSDACCTAVRDRSLSTDVLGAPNPTLQSQNNFVVVVLADIVERGEHVHVWPGLLRSLA